MDELKKKIQNFDQKTLLKCLKARGWEQTELFRLSRQVKEKVFGQRIWYRCIIEFSNLCRNNCFYCGLRIGNKKVYRYKMSLPEIAAAMDFIRRANYGSVVFQSGEIRGQRWEKYLLAIVRLTKKKYPGLAITVSCGEQDRGFYKRLRQAGADRYLLRIETSSQKLYEKLHPKLMSWSRRYQCLKWLKELGYQVGTGVMVGLPGQTPADLIGDLRFFKDSQFHMFGLGPYVIHKDTPLAAVNARKQWREDKAKIYHLTLNFLALLRIIRPTANIAAATALDVFNPSGRIMALQVAANVIMPSVTPRKYREHYVLYQNKPCLDEEAKQCLGCLTAKIKSAGLQSGLGEAGTSPLYLKMARK